VLLVVQKLITYYREVVVEMGKVSWPSREELKTSTIVVLVVTIIFALFIGAFDWILSQIVNWFLG
jgi:preprotein translocase subunit SecE